MKGLKKTAKEPRNADGEVSVATPLLPPESAAPAPYGMRSVLRALARAQARAIVLERLAVVVVNEFCGDGDRPPTKLLRLANGSTGRAEVADVLDIERELLRMAHAARVQMNALNDASVLVERCAMEMGDTGASGPLPIPPEGEHVAPNPASHPPGPRRERKSRAAGAHAEGEDW